MSDELDDFGVRYVSVVKDAKSGDRCIGRMCVHQQVMGNNGG